MAENYTPPHYIHKQVSPMYQEFSFDVREFVNNFVSHKVDDAMVLNHYRNQLAIKFAYGKQVRVETVEEPPQEISKRSVEPTTVFGYGGYASVKDALIGFLNSEGLESVLHYWGIVPTRVKVSMRVLTVTISTYRTQVQKNSYVNVVPLPKNFDQHRIRYAYRSLERDQRYKFQDAIEDFNDLTWLSSIPPTVDEVSKAASLPYEDVNFAPLMQG